MSWLSDISRTFTGSTIGENLGGTVAGLFSGGNPAAIEAGRRVGGATTQFIDMDGSEGQATARSVNQNLPQESGGSGNRMINPYANDAGTMMQQPQTAFLGPLVNFGRGAVQTAARNLPAGGGSAVGYGLAGAGVSMIMDAFGQPKRFIITRKMQREVKELFAYANGDMGAVAQIYSQFKGMNYSPDMILAIMLKKFRNDGPYVTKAAVRKTRSTIRKMSRLNQLYADITPKARPAARRRAASTTRITQVK